jgi:DNA topoisomerase III
VYDLITRHFLACCSKDAVGVESEIIAMIGSEYFRASHLAIKEKNYLEIYPFDRWVESEFPG